MDADLSFEIAKEEHCGGDIELENRSTTCDRSALLKSRESGLAFLFQFIVMQRSFG
jgi:hypothetical protein